MTEEEFQIWFHKAYERAKANGTADTFIPPQPMYHIKVYTQGELQELYKEQGVKGHE